MMEPPAANTSFTPFITCSTCDVEVPMHLLADHVCERRVLSSAMVEEPEQMPMPTIQTPPAHPSEPRPPRPFVPRIDPFAASKTSLSGELTPASSGPGSAAASPISPSSSLRSPFLHPPRKASSPAIRRPPSPELLSQDCAFPPFPTGKPKKKDQQRTNARGRTQTPEIPSTKSLGHERVRSASVGPSRSRTRQGTGDSSRPSTASSSRQPSMSSRAGSRQGSLDVVPPLPPLQPSMSHPTPETENDSKSPQLPSVWPLPPEPSPSKDSASEEPSRFSDLAAQKGNDLTAQNAAFPPRTFSARPEIVHSPADIEPVERQPSYKAKRPPPITNMPPNTLIDPSNEKLSPSPNNQPPPTSGSSIARTLTSLFSRKRGVSSSSKKSNPKTPATDGPRFAALSPEPDPQGPPGHDRSSHSSISTDMIATPPIHGGIQEVPRSSTDVQVTRPEHHIPEPSQAQIAQPEDDHDDHDDHNDHNDQSDFEDENPQADHDAKQGDAPAAQRDTLQLEQDLEKRLATMGAPKLSIVAEAEGDDGNDKRASIGSASSYGSVGFSHGSTSSRSMHIFDGHSHGSSISTHRTTSSSDDALVPQLPKFNPDAIPDSPTDPYLQNGRLAPVPEALSPPQSEKDENIDGYFQGSKMLMPVPDVLSSPETEKEEPITQLKIPVPPTPSSEVDKFDFPEPPRQRRPSTPGAFRGFCRGCSKRILSGQKSVSSKDGRLTGRYHKECFVCMTCKEPFATADFYVHEDHPYCAHHYHELNGTLCESCGRGIEGQYMETSNTSGHGAKKFHPDCLKCATCQVQLYEDYFELGGKVYCERDAFRMTNGPRSPYGTAPSRPSPLNREYVASGTPGQALTAGKFPERRLTKLMTTF